MEMVEYGYKDDVMHPLTKEVAIDLWENKNLPVYKLYEDNTESLVDDISDIQNHDGIFGIETTDWDNYLQRMDNLEKNFTPEHLTAFFADKMVSFEELPKLVTAFKDIEYTSEDKNMRGGFKNLTEDEIVVIATKYKNGEDVSTELAEKLLFDDKSMIFGFTLAEAGALTDQLYRFGANRNYSLTAEKIDSGLNCKCNNTVVTVSFEEIGKALLDRIDNTFDIKKEPVQQELIDGILPKFIAIEAIMDGSGFENGKHRIETLYSKNFTAKERATAIKEEYGTGGMYDGSNVPYVLVGRQSEAKGLKIEWNNENRERLNKWLIWSQVEKLIAELVEKDAYITPEEKEKYNRHIETEAKIKLLSEGDVININGEQFTFLNSDYSRIEVAEPNNKDNNYIHTVQDKYYIYNYVLEKHGFTVENKEIEQPEAKEEKPIYRFFRGNADDELKIIYPKDNLHFTTAVIDPDVIATARDIYKQDGNTETFFSMLLAYAKTETVDNSTLFYINAKNEYESGIALLEGFNDEVKDTLINFAKTGNLSNDEPVKEPETVEEPIKIGDKFKNLFTGDVCEVVSLTGAIPWQTDQCAVKRVQGNFEITEDVNRDDLLNPEKYERVSEVERKPLFIPALNNIDLNTVDSISIQIGISTYEGGFDSDGHEAKDNYSYETENINLYPSDDKTEILARIPYGNEFGEYYDKVYKNDLEGQIALANDIYKFMDSADDYSVVSYKNGEKQYIPCEIEDVASYFEKALITEYTQDEFSEEPDFTNTENIGLAYTTVDDKNNLEHTVQVTTNLETRKIYTDLDNIRVATEAYGSRRDFIECLKALNFDELTDITDEMWQKYEEFKAPEVSQDTQKPQNFTLTEENMNIGTPKEQFKANIEAIKLLKELEADNKQATPEQQTILAKYMGWGGLADAFDEHKDSWSTEYNQLKDLLTYEEYNSARATVLNSHFTSPTIIKAMYKGLEQLGFEGGNILEPSMGVGNFFGAMPEDMQKNSKLYGVELDDLTGRIAKQLYHEANIQIKGFQKTAFNSNSFDVAIGNVPFGTNKIYDSEIQSHDLIHDYFFKKALDKVHPGGVVAFVTSMGTMDKANEGVRKYIAERAKLVGAVRLPDTAFKNANTSVTSDIIFLKKRDTVLDFEEEPFNQPDWVQTKEDENGNIINAYFADHPEMIVGEMTEESGPYGNRLVCKPKEGDFSQQLNEAISHLQGTFKRDEQANSVEEEIPEEFTQVSEVVNFT